jgi:hypothetical protein
MAVNTYTYDGAVLGAAATKQGTDVPALTKRVITSACLTNTTGGPIAATVNLAPAAGVAAANTVISARAIAAGETYTCPELINQGIDSGGAVWALGNGLSFKYTAKDVISG